MFGKPKMKEIPETAKETYEFRYRLTYEEAYEAFLNLLQRGNKKLRTLATIAVGVIATGLLIGFAMDHTRVHFIYTALMSVIVLALLIYLPELNAKKGAKKVGKAGGSYQVRISRGGQVILPRREPVPLAGDKNSRAVETENLFVIRTDVSNTLCIPKRTMKDPEIEDIRKILKTYIKYQDRR